MDKKFKIGDLVKYDTIFLKNFGDEIANELSQNYGFYISNSEINVIWYDGFEAIFRETNIPKEYLKKI